MISACDVLHLPYTRDLTEGGIAYALRSLPYSSSRINGLIYDHLRRTVAGTAVELAFRHYLSEQDINFEVKGAAPFTEPDRYHVALGGRRCDIKSLLITHPGQIAEIQRNPQVLLRAPALVPSDQHAGCEHSPRDFYLFAFLPMIEHAERQHFVHVMPDAWNRPPQWNPLGTLVLKSDSEKAQLIEIGGQDEGRERHSCTVELPPRTRVEVQTRFFTLAYVHTKSAPTSRIGIHSSLRKETHLIGEADWGNLWISARTILLAGYLSREEFRRRARFVPAGTRVFPDHHTPVKSLTVPISELRPFSELFERVRVASQEQRNYR